MSASRPSFVDGLDGTLTVDPDALRDAGRDLGRLREGRPAAVLRPGSVDDICKVVARCRDLGLSVAAQGAAHTVGGQRLAEGGVAVDMTCLADVAAAKFAEDRAWVDAPAGMLWSTLTLLLLEHGRRFAGGDTGYLDLTVGGTLSVGGIGCQPAKGAQVDYVLELDVVTGDGSLISCSAAEHPDLFDAARAGLGQVGIITRAKLQLVPAHPTVASAVVPYTDPSKAFEATRIACSMIDKDHEEDECFVMITPPMPDGASMVLNVHLACPGPDGADRLDEVKSRLPEWHAPGSAAGRRTDPKAQRPAGAVQTTVLPLRDHLFQFTELINRWRRDAGWDDLLKPWFDQFLSGAAAESYVIARLQEMTDEDWSEMGFVLFFPHRRNAFGKTRLMLPDAADPDDPGELMGLFDVLCVSPAAPSITYDTSMAARNHSWERAGHAVGGTRYPISEVPSPEGWRAHYGDTWPEVLAAIHRYNPRGNVTPGPGIPRD
ncbi:FAD-binding protein (plasmid) [Amycolatopsis sp. FU40]|uniref:FAD-binding protein n=1 Tax=Amycolatopsis sp. FU40 TaxID=2914159 RepID=UPI001F2CBA91|nr:FAD-binding protein [Amycolatopsis sp. FU40]UKD50899.1 FAD-binding protein [Amycolatopsis sp. FU40]